MWHNIHKLSPEHLSLCEIQRNEVPSPLINSGGKGKTYENIVWYNAETGAFHERKTNNIINNVKYWRYTKNNLL